MLGMEKSVDWFHTGTPSNIEGSTKSENSSSDLCQSYFDFSDPSINSMITFQGDVDEIKIYYDDDLNLKQIHTIIREKFIKILKKLSNADNEIATREWKIVNTKISDLDKIILRKEINEILEFRNKYGTVNLWQIYKKNVYPILSKYTPLMSKEVGGNINSGVFFDEELIKLRQQYIKEYIDEVNNLKIIKITPHFVTKIQPCCLSCMKPLQQDYSSEVGGSARCSCGFNESTIKHLSEYNDLTRSFASTVDTNLDAKQIKEWIDNVKCVTPNIYGKDEKNNSEREALFEKFDTLCQKHNLPNRNLVLSGRLPQPPMSVVISLIKLAKRSELYNNKHQIRHDYYGYPIYHIDEVQEAKIIKIYVELQNENESKKKRKTKIHIEVVGPALCILVGVKINPFDFKIPASKDTIAYSHNTFNEKMVSIGYKIDEIPNILDLFS